MYRTFSWSFRLEDARGVVQRAFEEANKAPSDLIIYGGRNIWLTYFIFTSYLVFPTYTCEKVKQDSEMIRYNHTIT